MLTVSAILILIFISFIAGFVDSIAGGGGLLMLPSLLLSGIPPHLALGTNKFVSTLGTSVSVWNFYRKGKIILKIALIGLIFMLIGGAIGSKLALMLDPNILGKILIAMLPIGMFATLIKKKSTHLFQNLSPSALYIKLPTIATILGIYDGFFGPGTGSFIILAFFIILNMSLVQASAHAKVLNLGSNLGALFFFLLSGKVWFLLGLPLALANMAGNYIGSHMAIKKGDGIVQKVLIAVWALLFLTLAWKYLKS